MLDKLMVNYPIPHNETERLNALRNYNILDSIDEHDFDRITELASIICEVPISLVSLIDEDRQWFKSNHGLETKETPRDLAFCQYAIMDSGVFEVEDAAEDPRFFNNDLVTGKPDIRFYAGYPLIDSEGFALGTLCVIDRKPKRLTGQQTRALQLLSQETMALIKERAQKTELKNFQKLFDYSTDLMFVGNSNGFFEKVNPSFTKVFGWTEHELLNTSHYQFLHPDDLLATEQKLEEMASGKVCLNFVQRFRTRYGQYRVIQWTSSPELSTGKIYGIGRDITDAHKLQKELQATREMLEQTNQVAKVGGWSLDIAKEEIYWSPVTRAIHAVPVDFVPNLETGISFYKEGISRDMITNAVNSAVETGSSWDLQLQIVNFVGQDVWVRAKGEAELKDGKCVRLLGTFQDITDYKMVEFALKDAIDKQEALNKIQTKQIQIIKHQDKTLEKIREFKFLADSIPQIIWTARSDGEVDYFNQHWYNYTGLPIKRSKGFGWMEALHPDDVEKCRAIWSEAVAQGKPYEAEYRFKRGSDSVYKWHLARALPMLNDNCEIVKWFGSSTDIDEYKRALQLETRIRQYEDFNHIVAHNLRGPAGNIQTILNMINAGPDSETEKQELLDMLGDSSLSLNETLNQLMDVLEVRNNHQVTYDDCRLEDIVNDVKRMLNGQMREKKAQITVELKCQVIKFPRIYLESIFYNMISNALKYSKAGVPPVIEVRSDLKDGKIELRFKDNGLGIDLLKHGGEIFKLNKIFHKGYDSKGVGLFMTKMQIETFGGDIEVKSEPNVGTEFIVKL